MDLLPSPFVNRAHSLESNGQTARRYSDAPSSMQQASALTLASRVALVDESRLSVQGSSDTLTDSKAQLSYKQEDSVNGLGLVNPPSITSATASYHEEHRLETSSPLSAHPPPPSAWQLLWGRTRARHDSTQTNERGSRREGSVAPSTDGSVSTNTSTLPPPYAQYD